VTNPFDLNGPQFLVFYTALGILFNLILRIIFHGYRREALDIELKGFSDSYTVAYLRSGFREMLRIAIFSLMKRGLLRATNTLIESSNNLRNKQLIPLEKAILNYFNKPRSVTNIYTDAGLISLSDEYKRDLEKKGVLNNHSTLRQRKRTIVLFLAILIGVTAFKILLAIQRGHSNIAFLVILTIIFCVMALMTWPRRRTPKGDVVLQTLQIRTVKLRKKDKRYLQNRYDNDADLHAALFSLSVLPALEYPYIKKIFPKESRPYGGGVISAAGCGGGGCGGGGCGGGCGGCGG
jgi:uncharacterized protein (TIGR04222 family)